MAARNSSWSCRGVNKVLILLGALWLAGCSAISQTPSAIRVVTYNIHAGKDAQRVDNLARVAAVIDSMDADVVLLQEVDRQTERSGRTDHFAELRRLTGMFGVFGKSLDFQGGEYGIAILSRWPLDSVATVPLSVDPPQPRSGAAYEPRIALHVRVRSPAGSLHVINTHLDASGAGTFRRQELIAALAHMKHNVPEAAPLVFGGDLNARPATNEIGAVAFSLTDAFAACGQGAGETFPAHAPDRRIDYIFFRRARCEAARVVETQASDHRPMLAIMVISGVQ
jgi:endonuclease/exonuclease/phosphatase family metal-dependent hydrolase